MKMRKLIALVMAVMMLFCIIPAGAVSAVADANVIENTNFDDGEKNGWSSSSAISVEDGVLVFNVTQDWGNIYKYSRGMKANTDYVYTFRAKANMSNTMNIFVNDNWGKDTAHITFDVTTEWQEFTVDVNSGDYQSAAILLFSANGPASTGLVFYLDYITITEGTSEPEVPSEPDEPVAPDEPDGNLIVNGGFETGDAAGWRTWQSTEINADAAYNGNYGLHIKNPTGGWAGTAFQDFNVTVGKTYEVTMWVKNLDGARGQNIQIQNGGQTKASKWFDNTATWTLLTFEFTATAENCRINFCGGGTGANEELYVDDVKVEELIDPSFDGYIKNGNFETGKDAPWILYSGTAISADAAYNGNYGLHIKNPTGGWGGTAFQDFNVTVGKTYEVTMWVKNLDGARGQFIQIQNGGETKASKWFDNTTTWTLLTFEFTATAENCRIIICGGGTGANEELYVDDIKVEELIDPSFDGYIYNGDFETGELYPWDNLWGSNAVEIVEGMDGGYGLYISAKMWSHVRQTGIAVEPNTDYKISVWAKNTSNMCILVKNGDDSQDILLNTVYVGDSWTEITYVFNSGDNTAIIFSLMGGGFDEDRYGTFDNISIEVVPKEPTSAVIDFTDRANRTHFSAEQQVWEQNGIVVTNNKDASTTNVADYVKPARFYKSSTVMIEYPGMTKIVIDCTGLDAKYVNGWADSVSANATATVENNIVTIVLAEAADSFVWETLTAQSRAYNITVYGEGGETPDEPDVPVEPDDGNRIVNGDFETGDASGWEIRQSSTISADAAKDGAYGAHLVGNGGWGGLLAQTMTVVPGKQYKLSFWINVNAMGVNVQVKNGVGAALEGAGGWFDANRKDKQVEWTFTATDSSVVLNFCGSGTGSAEDVYVDNFSLVYIPPCEHSYVAVVTAPDCVNGGYTVYTCSVCGDSYVANYTAALGHAAGAAADCTNPQVCTVCGKVLNAALGHAYDNVCDSVCNVCEAVRVAPHTYVNACDRDCNLCGVTRIAPHAYDGDCDSACNLCSFKRQSTADHVYTDDCDATCNVCGDIRTDLGHVYTDSCDYDCNHCGALREPPHHYGEKYDPTCDVCGTWREIVIVYGDANGDDSVDVRDITLLQQYLAGWDVTPDVVAADANGDGSVTIRDITLLQQYLAGWGATLG